MILFTPYINVGNPNPLSKGKKENRIDYCYSQFTVKLVTVVANEYEKYNLTLVPNEYENYKLLL